MDFKRIALFSVLMFCSYMSDYVGATKPLRNVEVDGSTREGYCPDSSCCGSSSQPVEQCATDSDCRELEKCCSSGCDKICRGPLPQTGRCLNMESGSLINFQVGDTDELQSTPINFIKIGFITRRKEGILLQIRKDDPQNNIFKSVTMSINNSGGIRFFMDLDWDKWAFNTEYYERGDDVTDGEAHEVTLTRNQQIIQMQVDNRQAVSAWLPVSFLDEFDSADIDSIFIANNNTYRGDRGFNGCIYSIQIDDIDLFERVVQEPRPSDIQLVPNEGAIFKDITCGSY